MLISNLISTLLFTILLISLSVFVDVAQARWTPCKQCIGNECKRNLDCRYGVTSNFCGWDECYKGPGQSCGGYQNIHGQCAEGLTCENNKCKGCFADSFVECYSYSIEI